MANLFNQDGTDQPDPFASVPNIFDYSRGPTDFDYSPDPMANGTGVCWSCNEPEDAHCDECSACPDQHAGWCSKDHSGSYREAGGWR